MSQWLHIKGMNKYIDILPIHVLYSHKLSFLTKVEILVLSTKHILFGHVPYISNIKVENDKSSFILNGVCEERKYFLKLFSLVYGNGSKSCMKCWPWVHSCWYDFADNVKLAHKVQMKKFKWLSRKDWKWE